MTTTLHSRQKSRIHRVHLRSSDGDHITVYVPLGDDGRLDPAGPRPWLFKAKWGRDFHYGEFDIFADGARMIWADHEESLTDLGGAPVRKGAVFRFYEGMSDSPHYDFTVVNLTPN